MQCLDPRVPTEQPRVKACYDSYAACMRKPAAVWSVGWVFLVLLSWLPRCYFCCCSRNPKSAAAGTAYGLQVRLGGGGGRGAFSSVKGGSVFQGQGGGDVREGWVVGWGGWGGGLSDVSVLEIWQGGVRSGRGGVLVEHAQPSD